MISDKQLGANRSNAETDEAVRPYPRDTERAGSALGQGAKTDEGVKRSRLNALRHGITGQVTTMTDEDRAAHDAFSKALMNDLALEGAMEIQLAQRIATDSWRWSLFDETVRHYRRNVLAKRSACGQRISAVEDNLFALGQLQNGGQACPDVPQIDAGLTTAHFFTQESTNLQLLTLYEQRLNRAVQKDLALLQSLQAARQVQRAAAMQEAAALLQLNEMKGLEYLPERAAQAQVRCAANSKQNGFVFSNDQIHSAIDSDQRLHRASTADFSKYRPRKFQTQAAA